MSFRICHMTSHAFFSLDEKDGLVSSGDETQSYDQHCWTFGMLHPLQLEEQILPHPANGANMSGSFKLI